MNKFSLRSLGKLSTCHVDLQFIAKEAIAISDIDFGISEGERSIERQKELFDEGKSRIDGVTRKGKHNYHPSLAFDIYAWVGNASWEKKDLIYLGGVITSVANHYYDKGIIKHKVRWGGNWDKDGIIISDQNFQDLPHFELYKP